MLRRKITDCLVVIVLFLEACSLITADVPLDKVRGYQVFENADSAVAAITGIYEGIATTTNFLCGGSSVYAGIYADELVYTGLTVPILEFSHSTLTSGNSILESAFWNNSYYLIYRTNACIAGLAASKTLDARLRDQLMGEAKFFRALLYFYLIHYFGDVPLATTTDQSVNERIARTAAELVKVQIETDLHDAQQLLSPAYVTLERARVNKWCATALLARFYMYEKNWSLAAAFATEVINSGLYRLMPVDSVFLLSSQEALLQIQPVTKGHHTLDGLLLLPAGNVRPGFVLTDALLRSFEAGDQRKKNWVDYKYVNGVSYAYPFKYKKRPDSSPEVILSEYTTLLRFAELYLIRAECRTALDQLQDAVSDVDIVRKRAGLPLVSVSHPDVDTATLMKLIEQERRVEFFAELGHRWLDLKRRGEADRMLLSLKQGWKGTGLLWPIPAAQIEFNQSLVQNPGYH